MSADQFQAGDRVIRRNRPGPEGTVTKVRIEQVRTSLKEAQDGQEAPGVTVSVLWDNGTTSHFVPGGLEKVGA